MPYRTRPQISMLLRSHLLEVLDLSSQLKCESKRVLVAMLVLVLLAHGHTQNCEDRGEVAKKQEGAQWVLTSIAEMNRIYLVLFDMNNRIFGPYSAAIRRILVSAMLDIIGHRSAWQALASTGRG
jgi:hypothetical protein